MPCSCGSELCQCFESCHCTESNCCCSRCSEMKFRTSQKESNCFNKRKKPESSSSDESVESLPTDFSLTNLTHQNERIDQSGSSNNTVQSTKCDKKILHYIRNKFTLWNVDASESDIRNIERNALDRLENLRSNRIFGEGNMEEHVDRSIEIYMLNNTSHRFINQHMFEEHMAERKPVNIDRFAILRSLREQRERCHKNKLSQSETNRNASNSAELLTPGFVKVLPESISIGDIKLTCDDYKTSKEITESMINRWSKKDNSNKQNHPSKAEKMDVDKGSTQRTQNLSTTKDNPEDQGVP